MDYADQTLPVASINLGSKTVTLGQASHYGVKEQKKFYAFNILAELDEEGEYFIDRNTGMLFFYPTGPIETLDVFVSLLEKPMVSLRKASHITFSCLTFEYTRGTAVQMIDTHHTLIRNANFRGIGNVAVIFGEGWKDVVGGIGSSIFDRSFTDTMWNRRGGTHNKIVGCEITQCGMGGVILGGGDRGTVPLSSFHLFFFLSFFLSFFFFSPSSYLLPP